MAIQRMLLCLLIIGFCGHASAGMFNCLRNGQTCDAGTCNSANPAQCTCTTGTAINDYHCFASVPAACSKYCANGGICKTLSGTDTCLCTSEFTGANCEMARILVECTATAMKFSARPHGTFAGKIFVNGQAGDADCVLDQTGTGPNQYYFKEILYTKTACLTTTAATGADPKKVVGEFIIQYLTTPNILQSTDQLVTATCEFSKDAAPSAGVVTSSLQKTHLTAETGGGKYTGVTLQIQQNSASTAAANVGDELSLVAQLSNDNDQYTDLLIKSCDVYNTDLSDASIDPTGSTVTNFAFITDGCSVSPIASGSHTKAPKVVTAPFLAFMWAATPPTQVTDTAQTSTLFFRCDVLLCTTATASDCNEKSCTGASHTFPKGFGRRRRNAEGDTQTLTASVTVRFENSTVQETISGDTLQQPGVDTASCMKDPGMQAVVSALGMSLGGLVIATAVLGYLLSRRRSRGGKGGDDGYNMGSSSQNLHIPRPSM